MIKENKIIINSKNNLLLSLCSGIMLFAVISIIFPSIYILNDDLMIQSIVSGSFLRPCPYTYYLSVELGFVLSFLYSIFPNVPWLGIFFVFIYFLVFVLISYRLLSIYTDSFIGKVVSLIIVNSVFMCVFFVNEIMLTYTVVAAVSICGGIFLLLTARSNKDIIVSFIFFALAYLIRGNVFYMGIPYIFVSIIYTYIKDRIFFIKNSLKNIICFLFIFVILFFVNKLLPVNDEWKQYREYNELRTSVYDYIGIYPDRDDALLYYSISGLSYDTILMYYSYDISAGMYFNGGSQIEINKSKDCLNIFEGYKELRNSNISPIAQIKEAIWVYFVYMLNYDSLRGYHLFLIGVYILFLFLVLISKKYKNIIIPPVVFILRSIIWIFLAYNGRFPNRVLISSMLMEGMVLLSIMTSVFMEKKNEKKYSCYLASFVAIIFLFLAFLMNKGWIKMYDIEKERIMSDNAVYSFMMDNPDNFYFIDVDSVVNHSEYAIKNYNFSYENYAILGGWISGHPIMLEKAKKIKGEKYFVVEESRAVLCELFEENLGVKLSYCDKIDNRFGVYKIDFER